MIINPRLSLKHRPISSAHIRRNDKGEPDVGGSAQKILSKLQIRKAGKHGHSGWISLEINGTTREFQLPGQSIKILELITKKIQNSQALSGTLTYEEICNVLPPDASFDRTIERLRRAKTSFEYNANQIGTFTIDSTNGNLEYDLTGFSSYEKWRWS